MDRSAAFATKYSTSLERDETGIPLTVVPTLLETIPKVSEFRPLSMTYSTKGYFANQRNRRGRQLGRVLASRYEKIVVDRLFGGTIQLTKALRPLMQAAEQTLQLDRAKRRRTLVRVDAGGGSLDEVNWLLRRGYQVRMP